MYSIKGGVGKTTAAINLAATAAARGWRVLLWDLDPQGAATYLLRVKHKVKGGGRSVVELRKPILDVVRATDVANLDLVPSDFRYRHLDLFLDAADRPERRLREVLKPVRDRYDWVILDCAPSVSLVTEGVLDVSDGLLIPVVPSPLSARTVAQLVSFIAELGQSRSPEVLAFFSMVDRRRALHQSVVRELPDLHPGMFTGAMIPSAAAVEKMSASRLPLVQGAPASPAAKAYADLWAAVERRWSEP